jgi:chemotaxis-related protein WspB
MLVVLFRSGGDLYGLEARKVIEVIPRVGLRTIPHAPAFVAGLLAYRGRVAAVVDFAVLTGAGPSRECLSTRILLAAVARPGSHASCLGLIAEDVSRVVSVDRSQVVSPTMGMDEAPYLGPIIRTEEGLAQLVDADRLLGERLANALCGGEADPG